MDSETSAGRFLLLSVFNDTFLNAWITQHQIDLLYALKHVEQLSILEFDILFCLFKALND